MGNKKEVKKCPLKCTLNFKAIVRLEGKGLSIQFFVKDKVISKHQHNLICFNKYFYVNYDDSMKHIYEKLIEEYEMNNWSQ